jgi:hypothetical protein
MIYAANVSDEDRRLVTPVRQAQEFRKEGAKLVIVSRSKANSLISANRLSPAVQLGVTLEAQVFVSW